MSSISLLDGSLVEHSQGFEVANARVRGADVCVLFDVLGDWLVGRTQRENSGAEGLLAREERTGRRMRAIAAIVVGLSMGDSFLWNC